MLTRIAVAASTWFQLIALMPAAAASGSTSMETTGPAGILPDVMAAAGSSSASASLLFGALAESPETVVTMIATRAQADLAGAAFTDAAQLRWFGVEGSDVAAAVRARDDADAAAQAAVEAVRLVALAPLPESERINLNIIWSNRSRRVPMEFRVLELDDATWRAVRRALLEEARAAADGTELDPAMAALLADIRGDPAVMAAKQSMEANLGALQEAFAVVALPPQ